MLPNGLGLDWLERGNELTDALVHRGKFLR
jgi:hypothetical protein